MAAATSRHGGSRLGCQPHQYGASVGGVVGAGPKRRLVAGFLRPDAKFMAHPAVELQQILSIHRSSGRRGNWLWTARRNRRGAGEPETWTADHQYSE